MKNQDAENILSFPHKLSSGKKTEIHHKNNKELRKYSIKVILKSLYEEGCKNIDDGYDDSLYTLLTSLTQGLEKNHSLKKKIIKKILNELQTKKVFN